MVKKSGWKNYDKFQSKRHSNAKKYGSAGGKYAGAKKRFKKQVFISEPFGLPRELQPKDKFYTDEELKELKADKINKADKSRYLASLRYQYGGRARDMSKELFGKNMEDLTSKKDFDKLFANLEKSSAIKEYQEKKADEYERRSQQYDEEQKELRLEREAEEEEGKYKFAILDYGQPLTFMEKERLNKLGFKGSVEYGIGKNDSDKVYLVLQQTEKPFKIKKVVFDKYEFKSKLNKDLDKAEKKNESAKFKSVMQSFAQKPDTQIEEPEILIATRELANRRKELKDSKFNKTQKKIIKDRIKELERDLGDL